MPRRAAVFDQEIGKQAQPDRKQGLGTEACAHAEAAAAARRGGGQGAGGGAAAILALLVVGFPMEDAFDMWSSA